MKKIFIIIFSLLLSSCAAPYNRTYEVSQEESLKSDRLVIFEVKYGYKLVYDRETGVEYFYAIGGSVHTDYLTPLVDRDGKPKIHDGY